MSLNTIVRNRETADELPFSVVDGNVNVGRNPLLVWFSPIIVLVPMNARSFLTTPLDHERFDALLMYLTTTSTARIKYVTTIAGFMDPKARFSEWLKGELLPASVGLNLTHEELAVPSAYKSAKAKFVTMFTPPKPAMSEGGIDLTLIFNGEQIAEIEAWRAGGDSALSSEIMRMIDRDQKERNLLRITNTGGKSYRVETPNGHRMTRTAFFYAYNNAAKDVWERVPPNGEVGRLGAINVEAVEGGRSLSASRRVAVYNNYIAIGCQHVPRAEVERIVAEFNKMGFTR